MTAPNRSPSAVVIGAGPYGLSVAAHLLGRGVSVRVFGEPMEAWRSNMPVGMFLKSTPSASSISAPQPGRTLADYCRTIGLVPLTEEEVVPLDLFVNYGRWFQEQVVPVEPERITEVVRTSTGFDVTLASKERISVSSVVMAAGHVQFAWIPPVLAALAADETLPTRWLSHTCHHQDLSQYSGQTVAVIGAGQSALENAALLHEAGATVHLLVRAPRVVWGGPPETGPPGLRDRILKPESPLGPGWSHVACHRGAPLIRFLPSAARLAMVRSILGPFGSWWLHDRVESVIDIRVSHEVTAATIADDRIVLDVRSPEATSRLTVDHVMAATGYRVDVDQVRFLDPSIRAAVTRVEGSPKLDGGFQSTVPGLYFAGLSSAATFGPLMRFVCGTEFSAPRTAAAVAARG